MAFSAISKRPWKINVIASTDARLSLPDVLPDRLAHSAHIQFNFEFPYQSDTTVTVLPMTFDDLFQRQDKIAQEFEAVHQVCMASTEFVRGSPKYRSSVTLKSASLVMEKPRIGRPRKRCSSLFPDCEIHVHSASARSQVGGIILGRTSLATWRSLLEISDEGSPAFCRRIVTRHLRETGKLTRTCLRASSTLQAGLRPYRSNRGFKPFEEMFATQQASKASQTYPYHMQSIVSTPRKRKA